MSGIGKLLNTLRPPANWITAVNFLVAVIVGLSIYMFYIARAGSYLSDDPKTCVNCHVMAPEYATWANSSHKNVTNCNDCHVPHDNAFKKYAFKAKDGLYHASVFTMGTEPQAIIMKEEGIKVVQQNCIRCHNDLNDRVKTNRVTREMNLHGEGKLCWDCHRHVPHGTIRSQSSVPNANVPVPESPVPAWLKSNMSKN
ncbi:MAG: cytochrome c nitrite reductase small subunit [Schleiferiaceae bacterium]|jgi:cytochrome c nitrite reductase small subunit|nr:cytochrome c nitrite reductase small subunit [Schleiferiaceae bacterium]